MKRLSSFTGVITALAVFGIAPAFGQTTIDIDGVTYNVVMKYNRPIGRGPAQTAGVSAVSGVVPNANASGGLQFYTANYTSFGKSNPFNLVGTDPSLGANTTTIPVVIVPIKLMFNSTGRVLDGTNQVAATVNSPIFLTSDYVTGGTDVGVTQYGDAIQRAQFWNFSGFSPAGYHVLLGAPTIAPTVSIIVPTASGTTNGSGTVGTVKDTFFDPLLDALVPSFGPNVLPIFLTDNVFESSDGTFNTCCILGYHASEGPPIITAHTWIYAAYTRSGTFSGNVIQDVQPLSHEVSEWINDPFVGTFPAGINLIPPAKLPGQGGACIVNFETGDPLEAPPVVFTKVTNGTTYHLQDEAYLWWYTHGASFGANGFFSFTGAFLTFSSLCGPG
jgi:hypothetical protein